MRNAMALPTPELVRAPVIEPGPVWLEIVQADLRLRVLQILADVPMCKANETVVANLLDLYGHAVVRDQLRVELEWLVAQSVVRIDHETPLVVVTATARGVDVAKGRTTLPGIARPELR